MTANMDGSEKYCLQFLKQNKRHQVTVYSSAVKRKTQPEAFHRSSISHVVFLSFFPQGLLFFLKETQIGKRQMGKFR